MVLSRSPAVARSLHRVSARFDMQRCPMRWPGGCTPQTASTVRPTEFAMGDIYIGARSTTCYRSRSRGIAVRSDHSSAAGKKRLLSARRTMTSQTPPLVTQDHQLRLERLFELLSHIGASLAGKTRKRQGALRALVLLPDSIHRRSKRHTIPGISGANPCARGLE